MGDKGKRYRDGLHSVSSEGPGEWWHHLLRWDAGGEQNLGAEITSLLLNMVTWRCLLTSRCRGPGSSLMSVQRLGWCVALGLITEYLKPWDWPRSPRE